MRVAISAASRVRWNLATRSCLSEVPCSGFTSRRTSSRAPSLRTSSRTSSRGCWGVRFRPRSPRRRSAGRRRRSVNVLYGLCNLAVAYALLLHVGDFEPRSALHAGAVRSRPRRDVSLDYALTGTPREGRFEPLASRLGSPLAFVPKHPRHSRAILHPLWLKTHDERIRRHDACRLRTPLCRC